VPKCILEKSPNAGQLFPDSQAVEREYYDRTGIFPIMHTVVMRKDLLEKHPELAMASYHGFCDAKKAAMDRYRHGLIFHNMDTMFPWFSDLIERDRKLLGEDWWPYGIEANRKAIDQILHYHFEQGVTDRLFRIEDIFAPQLIAS
jgi:4,5-dihydroxyphthalate decarboxylase